MAWHAKPRRTRKPGTANYVVLDPTAAVLNRIASSLRSRLAFAEKTDPAVQRLTARLKELSAPKDGWHPTTAAQVYRYDLRSGRTASWYDAEAEALAADLEHVISAENRRLLQGELEKARRELYARVCRSFGPLLALPGEQRGAVLLSLGIDPGVFGGDSGRTRELPTRAAGRWSVTVRAPKEEDEWEPDREAAEVLEEEVNRGIDPDSFEGMARQAELIRRGQKMTIIYGSPGREPEEEGGDGEHGGEGD